MIQIIDSITSLVNGASCVVKDNSEIIWTDSRPQPTDAEIQAEVTRLQTEYDNNQYQRDRAEAYPSIADQLDMLWHTIDEGGTLDKTSEFYIANKAVKDANPKP